MIFEIIGWLGTVAILLAYFLNSTQKLSADDKKYQILNMEVGVIILMAYLFSRSKKPITNTALEMK